MRSQRGSASVHALWVVVGLTVVAVIVVQVVALVQLRHRAAAAADLAALAASGASARGLDGCARAVEVARANGADLEDCRMDLDVATVTTRLRSEPWWGGEWITVQRARAAPIDYVDP